MRKAGDVCFAEVSRDSEGMILVKLCGYKYQLSLILYGSFEYHAFGQAIT